MGRNKNFLSWLINIDNKKPLYLENGVVTEGDAYSLTKVNGQLANLETDPKGWRDTLVKYGRNDKYFGLFRDFTVPLTFALDAAKIIKSKMWNGKGIEAQVYFAISKLDRYQTLTTYRPWYAGEIDFSKYKQNKDTVELNVMEGGVSKYLKAFEGTTFEIPIATNPNAVNVYMDGLPFNNNIEYSIYDQGITTGATNLIGAGIVLQEGTTQGIINRDQELIEAVQPYPNGDWFMQSVSQTVSVSLIGTINLNVNIANNNLSIQFIKYNVLTKVRTDYHVVSNSSHPGGLFTFNFNFTIPFSVSEVMYLEINRGSIVGNPTAFVTGGSFKIKYEVTFAPTICKALRGQEVLAQLTNKMTRGLYYSQSNFLTNLNNIVFTSGTAIRGNTDSTLKISFEDFYKACKPFFTGVGVQNDKLILEDLPYFFQNTEILNLGNVDNLEVDVAEDKIYNTIKVGYRNNTYDNVNGTDEFNVTQQYTTDITKIAKEIDLTSSFRADMTGIELTRLNLSGKTTTDSKSDNDPFILSINTVSETILGVTAYRLLRNIYTFTSGLLQPLQAFNIELSPKRMLLKWLSYFNAMLDRQIGSKITFQSGEKNSRLATYRPSATGTEVIVESANLTINNTDPASRLFLPYYFSFKTEVPFNYLTVMNTNPYGLIKFSYKGNEFTGFMVDGGIRGATNDRQTWKLLAGPDNDMTKFI